MNDLRFLSCFFIFSFASCLAAYAQKKTSAAEVYRRRVDAVRAVPGLAAFWDFVQREDGAGGKGKFVAVTDVEGERRFPLAPRNISRDFWNDGDEATLADFPLLGRGPFGQAFQIRKPRAQHDLPVLLVPRTDLHNTRIDVKGPGRSVSMVVWLIYQGDTHGIAGIWHEGTDTKPKGIPAETRVRGQRQYGMFAGLAANPGAASVHVSENGLTSFGNTYARHLAVAPDKMKKTPTGAAPEQLDAGWTTIGFVYDSEKKIVTAYNDGEALDYWVEEPAKTSFYAPAERAWRQARLARIPGLQEGEEPDFPHDQFYEPPESRPLKEVVESETANERVVLLTYEFTKVRERRKKSGRKFVTQERELVALRANPWYFGHDIYAPASAEEGGPFTIGRVIHSNRHGTLEAWFGGVAVYDRVLGVDEMKKLSEIGKRDGPPVIRLDDVIRGREK
ncbi:MAG: hypothetical protein ABS46_01385 [Cytophagaceae bacterium SCN 52-12]|nr:MAG: hypothetical protein ABS46_01385 [Cytophagaceae bacterium SCN 52-12]